MDDPSQSGRGYVYLMVTVVYRLYRLLLHLHPAIMAMLMVVIIPVYVDPMVEYEITVLELLHHLMMPLETWMWMHSHQRHLMTRGLVMMNPQLTGVIID